MAGHQSIRMNGAAVQARTIPQPAQIGRVILISKERGLTAIATLNDVCRDTRQIKSGLSGHVTLLVTTAVVLKFMAMAVKRVLTPLVEKRY